MIRLIVSQISIYSHHYLKILMDLSSAEIIAPLNSFNSFPTDVLKWIKINAKPLFSLKLMQVCKYFQHKKFPYLVVHSLSKNNDGTWKYEDYEIITTLTLEIFSDCSLWITGCLFLYEKVDPVSTILSKIAVCQAIHLYCESQSFSFDEFKILTSCGTFEYVTFSNTAITDKDGNNAALERILQCLPNIICIMFDTFVPSIISLQDAANLNFSKFKLFKGYRVLETFDFNTFIEFMNFHPHLQWRLSYDEQFILSPNYKQQLEQYIIKLLETGLLDGNPPPIIHFPEQDPQITTDVLHQQYDTLLHEDEGT